MAMDPESNVLDLGSRVRTRTLDPGFCTGPWIGYPGPRILEPGLRTLHLGSRASALASRIVALQGLSPDPGTRGPGHWIQDHWPWIQNPGARYSHPDLRIVCSGFWI
jgi:hypothetical protein